MNNDQLLTQFRDYVRANPDLITIRHWMGRNPTKKEIEEAPLLTISDAILASRKDTSGALHFEFDCGKLVQFRRKPIAFELWCYSLKRLSADDFQNRIIDEISHRLTNEWEKSKTGN